MRASNSAGLTQQPTHGADPQTFSLYVDQGQLYRIEFA